MCLKQLTGKLLNKNLLILIAALLLSACMSTVETQVNSLSTLSDKSYGKTIYVSGFKEINKNSLEFSKALLILENKLAEKSFIVTKDSDTADYIAKFMFSVDGGQKITSTHSSPVYGTTGYSGASTYGSFYGNSYNSYTTLTPTYGVTGYSSYSSTKTVYNRNIGFYIYDIKAKQTVFEGKASSTGSCHAFLPVANEMIEALLTNFFTGGTTSTINLDIKNDAC